MRQAGSEGFRADGRILAQFTRAKWGDGVDGLALSPDGQRIALVAGSHLGLRETYVIPNHRGDPLFLDHRQGAGTEYLLEAKTMVDGILAWLP